jgi:hypothetical protein
MNYKKCECIVFIRSARSRLITGSDHNIEKLRIYMWSPSCDGIKESYFESNEKLKVVVPLRLSLSLSLSQDMLWLSTWNKCTLDLFLQAKSFESDSRSDFPFISIHFKCTVYAVSYEDCLYPVTHSGLTTTQKSEMLHSKWKSIFKYVLNLLILNNTRTKWV